MLARVITPLWYINSIAVVPVILCHLLIRRMFLASFLSGSMAVVIRYEMDPSYRASWRISWATEAISWWVVATFIAIVIGLLFLPFRVPRKTIPGCCAKCRYDLTGNVSGACPECGTKIALDDTGRTRDGCR